MKVLTQILYLNSKRVKIAGDDMEYLDKVLGVKVIYDDVEFKHLPNFIATRYRLQMVSMNEQKMIFLYTFYISLPRSLLPQIHRIAQILCCNAITISYNTNSVISVIFIQQFRIMRSENKRFRT